MPRRTKEKVRKHSELARTLITHLFGTKPAKLKYLSSGMTNFVFEVIMPGDDLIVRLSDKPEKVNFFLKEQWAVDKARKKGIPVPEILEVGNDIIGFPYMVTRRIKGMEATFHPERHEIIKQMGKYAAIIHTIPTKNFGHIFDWSVNTLSKNHTWKNFLQDELNASHRLRVLEKSKMLSPKSLSRVKALLKEMGSWKKKPTLSHGDIRLKNVMVDKAGKILAVIDWENCTSNVAPYWDMSISLHDLTLDESLYFIEGYGIKPKTFIEMTPIIKCLNILNYAHVIEKMIKRREKGKLEQYRARMHGAFDLFSM